MKKKYYFSPDYRSLKWRLRKVVYLNHKNAQIDSIKLIKKEVESSGLNEREKSLLLDEIENSEFQYFMVKDLKYNPIPKTFSSQELKTIRQTYENK